MMILDKIKQVFFVSFPTVVISSTYDVLHLFMDQSHPLSHHAIIRVVLENEAINSNTTRIAHRLSASIQITWWYMLTLTHYTQTCSHDPFILAMSQVFCSEGMGLYRLA